MEVFSAARSNVAGAAKKRNKAAQGDLFEDLFSICHDSAKVEPPLSPVGIANISCIQELNDTSVSTSGIAVADRLLGQLQELSTSLLRGAIDKSKLIEIKNTLSAKRHKEYDPALEELLGEIELRASIELEKYRSGE